MIEENGNVVEVFGMFFECVFECGLMKEVVIGLVVSFGCVFGDVKFFDLFFFCIDKFCI